MGEVLVERAETGVRDMGGGDVDVLRANVGEAVAHLGWSSGSSSTPLSLSSSTPLSPRVSVVPWPFEGRAWVRGYPRVSSSYIGHNT